jgi:hypothetical protein
MNKFFIAIIFFFSLLLAQYTYASYEPSNATYEEFSKKTSRVKTERVKGHHRKNGKYIAPYYRSKKTNK